ncbi:ComEC/Rec2 family competence protein [Methyloversatilis sp.]|uniref:ComEC/Rec2 family competence protein n=1 Tax=Methyloversatilis sp. TaxID=2569862 RepID=UPI003D29DFB8
MSIRLALSLVAGAFLASRLARLPDWPQLGALTVLALVCMLAGRRWRGLSCLGVLLASFCWAAGWGLTQLDRRLDGALEGRDLDIVGVVAGPPMRTERGLRFDFAVEQAPPGVPARVVLNWYDARGEQASSARPALPAGSRWQLRVRLKRPHGNMNPHGFDYEGWLFARGIGATGHVRISGDAVPRMLDAESAGVGYAVQRARQAVRERFERALGVVDGVSVTHPWAGVLIALAIGDQRAIPPVQWDLFERAGLTHLVSISGLHVTMVAALAGWLCAAVWRRVPALALRCPAQRAGVLAGLLAATAYCALAGFGIPAQRTLIMLATASTALLAGRFSSPARALTLAVAVVLPLHPLAVIDAGFWLSFGAVAVLFYAATSELGARHPLRRWLWAQAAITVGLAPLTLALFGRMSLLAPLVNLFAIPLVSGLITPLALLAVLLPIDLLLLSAHALTSMLMSVAALLTTPDWALWHGAAPPSWAVTAGVVGAGCALAPAGWSGRTLALPLMLPLLLFMPPRPSPGDMTVTVLDVGQGLAVHVQTAAHDLVFDTGPRYGAEADAGERLLLPYLRAAGVRRLDRLLVSHADSDHSGGAASLLDGMPVERVLSSVPAHDGLRLLRPDTEDCAAGQRWVADGVLFELLHPPPGAVARGARSSNALSCVLRVQSAHGVALITGDLLADGESSLVAAGAPLAAYLLVSPHHGSRTSSTQAFVDTVAAREVVHAVGYRNRFNHPHPAVAARYEAAGATQRRSDHDGAVRYRFTAAGIAIERSREQDARYWHNGF